jgi:hypothetical protein
VNYDKGKDRLFQNKDLKIYSRYFQTPLSKIRGSYLPFEAEEERERERSEG